MHTRMMSGSMLWWWLVVRGWRPRPRRIATILHTYMDGCTNAATWCIANRVGYLAKQDAILLHRVMCDPCFDASRIRVPKVVRNNAALLMA